MNKSKSTSNGPNLKDSIPDGKNIYVVTYSLLGSGSIEVQSTGPEQALQSVQTLPLEILIAKADFKNGLEVHEIRE